MTLAQIEYAEQRMQQQWHDLVMAEQAGQPLEVLEQMYDLYILLAEEFNALKASYARQSTRARRLSKLRSANVLALALDSSFDSKRSA